MSSEVFSLLDTFDEYRTEVQEGFNIVPRVIKAHLETLRAFEEVRQNWKRTIKENNDLSEQINNLQKEMQKHTKQMQDMQYGMTQVRNLLDRERKKRKLAEVDRDFFESQANQLTDILKDNVNKLSRETKEQLNIMKKNRPSTDLVEDRLDTITEFETTGSVISDLSYTRDEDDFDISSSENAGQKRPRASGSGCNRRKGRKKRRSSSAIRFEELAKKTDRVVATTTVTVDGSNNVHATAVIESNPDGKENLQPTAPPLESEDDAPMTPVCEEKYPFSSNLINRRAHNFQQKTMLKSESCNVCSKRIKFSTMSAKCRDCKAVCHYICKDKVPLPCIPNGSTPGKSSGLISEYTPLVPPMVPSLIVHCINEVEARGLSEVGLYRISGSEREVRALKEKFGRAKGVPNLSQVMDIHVICSLLKDFLRSLSDPLTTRARWNDFAKAVDEPNPEERKHKFYQIISGLPRPNRDTLAYLILHLQRVAEIPECKMPLKNLASVFGPTVIGYSCNEPEAMYGETQIGNKIMELLLNLPSDYWESFIKKQDTRKPIPDFLCTPSPNRTRPVLKLTILKDYEEDEVFRDALKAMRHL